MNIQLIEGDFKSSDALELITQMIQVKIKYHENKITNNHNEEDIKARETKIKRLQKQLFEFRNSVDANSKVLRINATVHID